MKIGVLVLGAYSCILSIMRYLTKIVDVSIIALLSMLCIGNAAAQDCPEIEEEIEPMPSLLVFVGKKINIEGFEPVLKQPKNDGPEECQVEVILLDAAYKAKYKILKPLYGQFPSKRLEFEMYTHFGPPQLPQGKHSLMFVYKFEDRLVSAKYLYYDVYKARRGNWAVCGDPFVGLDDPDDNWPDKYADRPKPQKIRFHYPIIHKIAKHQKDELEHYYPEKYYKVSGGKAVCRGLGYLVKDIFEIEKKGAWQLEHVSWKD